VSLSTAPLAPVVPTATSPRIATLSLIVKPWGTTSSSGASTWISLSSNNSVTSTGTSDVSASSGASDSAAASEPSLRAPVVSSSGATTISCGSGIGSSSGSVASVGV